MIHLPSSDDGEKVLIYILFYMMKTNSIEFFYNNILSVRELIGVRIQGSTTGPSLYEFKVQLQGLACKVTSHLSLTSPCPSLVYKVVSLDLIIYHINIALI